MAVYQAPSLSEWIAETPWGTTRPGLAARLACPPAATWIAIVSWAPDTAEKVASNLVLLVVAAMLLVGAYVLPWAFERFAQQTPTIRRRTDGMLFFPSIAASIVAILILGAAHSAPVAVAIATAQTAWIGLALLQGRSRRTESPGRRE